MIWFVLFSIKNKLVIKFPIMKKTISNRKIKHDINNIIFIPARTGSTRVPNKNIQKIGEETLLSRKIKNCLKAKIGEVIVSTNSAKLKNIQKN